MINPMLKKSMFVGEQEQVLVSIETQIAAGLTRQRLANETQIHVNDIERLLNRQLIGRYHSNSEAENAAAIEVLAEWLKKESAMHEDSGFAQTPTFQKLQIIMGNAHKSGELVAITGDVGIGKSEAAKAYVRANPRSHAKPGAVRVQFDKTDRKDAGALTKILYALRGGSDSSYRNGVMMQEIGAALRPGDCLILDECNFLGEAADIARCLNDDFSLPVIMIGNPDFSMAVWGKQEGFAALANRTLRFDFPHTTVDDVDAWLAWAGLSGAALRKAAVTIAARPGRNGGLRNLAKVISTAKTFYPNAPLDGDTLSQLAEQLGRR